MNSLKTAMLLAALTALFLWIGHALGGQSGMIMALAFAAVTNFIAYWFSDKIVLAMYHAKEATENDNRELFSIVQNLATRLNIPMPRVFIIPTGTPNAFATGRNPQHAAVAATQGIMEMLSRDELEGVLAHELGHVVNRDTLISTVAATIAGALSMLANMAMWGAMMGGGRGRDDDRGGNPIVLLVGLIVAPLAASLIQMAISRAREFGADEAGARLTGKPLALAGALQKIDLAVKRRPMQMGSPATAHLFIINPFRGQQMARLFSTHPATEERVAKLEELARNPRL